MKRRECDNCQNFEPLIMKDDNLIGDIFSKAKCKIGKRVMFRQPIITAHFVAWEKSGYIRYCNEFKQI